MILELSVGSAAPGERMDLELELRTLQDWVQRERVPGVRVVRKQAPVRAEEMGAFSDVVDLIVSGGDAVGAVAGISAAIHTWLSSRRKKVVVTLVRNGRSYEITQSVTEAELERMLLEDQDEGPAGSRLDRQE
jgi:hypothetical protein